MVRDGLGKAYVSQHVALVRPARKRLLPEWIAYVAASHVGKTYFATQGYGGTKIQLSLDDVAKLLVTVPTLPEQIALVGYLDRETTKIDALIAEQHLNALAPMKDSGVEWVAEVPGHWRVVPVKYIADVGNGSTPHRDRADYWTGGDYPWLSTTVVNGEVVLDADEFVT